MQLLRTNWQQVLFVVYVVYGVVSCRESLSTFLHEQNARDRSLVSHPQNSVRWIEAYVSVVSWKQMIEKKNKLEIGNTAKCILTINGEEQ